jgi:hypothetical protein
MERDDRVHTGTIVRGPTPPRASCARGVTVPHSVGISGASPIALWFSRRSSSTVPQVAVGTSFDWTYAQRHGTVVDDFDAIGRPRYRSTVVAPLSVSNNTFDRVPPCFRPVTCRRRLWSAVHERVRDLGRASSCVSTNAARSSAPFADPSAVVDLCQCRAAAHQFFTRQGRQQGATAANSFAATAVLLSLFRFRLHSLDTTNHNNEMRALRAAWVLASRLPPGGRAGPGRSPDRSNFCFASLAYLP